MSDLIESIQQYVSPDKPDNGAENVAIVFFAITALRISGVRVERKWLALSHFQFGYHGEEIKVSYAMQARLGPA